MNLETADTSPTPKRGFNAYVFDYFLVHPSITIKQTLCEENGYSDHNPVYFLFE